MVHVQGLSNLWHSLQHWTTDWRSLSIITHITAWQHWKRCTNNVGLVRIPHFNGYSDDREHRMEPLQKHWELRFLLFYSMADTEAPSSRTRLIPRALIQVQPLLSASGRTASWRNGLASQRTDVAPQVFWSPDFLEWQKSKFKRALPMTSLALQNFLMGASFPQVQHIHIHLHRNLH